jgi:hypothetical protein
MPLYHATLACSGLTEAESAAGAPDVEAGFRERPWHQNVVCRWDGSRLWIEAESDYDPDGRALYDEFWDEIVANIHFCGSIRIEIVSVKDVATPGGQEADES